MTTTTPTPTGPTFAAFCMAVWGQIKHTHLYQGGSRWPTPVAIEFCGKATSAGTLLGCDPHHPSKFLPGKAPLDFVPKVHTYDAIERAIKRLHAEGEVKFLRRWGYVWVIPMDPDTGKPIRIEGPHQPGCVEGDEWVADPGSDGPFNWSKM